jgi:hypothetical protein
MPGAHRDLMGAGMEAREIGVRRRELLAAGLGAAGALVLGPALLRDALAAPAVAGESPYGPLQAADANGLMLPAGFRSRAIARGGQSVAGYSWPIFSDGQATFRTQDGGWILVTNSESLAAVGAGTSAIRFAPDGGIRSAYRILGDTDTNCAGGPTPWGTWLSGEENEAGQIWECDPAGVLLAEARPAMGVFNHEAAAVDPIGKRVYLTEDEGDGAFYRFTPTTWPDLRTGTLEVAVVNAEGGVSWAAVPDPSGVDVPTRRQVPGTTTFDGGEGLWYARGIVYFTTKGDKKVWAYDLGRERIEVIFDREQAQDAPLNAVDNVTVSASGDVYVCEDGGNMEIGMITPDRKVSPFLRFVGPEHEGSEVCGVTFDPSGTRMYFTSQRAYPPLPGAPGPGAVYEVSGPFRLPDGGPPAREVFGPPAGELRPGGPLAADPGDPFAPGLELRVADSVARGRLLSRGLGVRVTLDEPGTVTVALRTGELASRAGLGTSSARPRAVTLARRSRRAARGEAVVLRLKPGRRARGRLRRRRSDVRAVLSVLVRDDAGNVRVETRRVRIGRER